jgi:hypothetical protein
MSVYPDVRVFHLTSFDAIAVSAFYFSYSHVWLFSSHLREGKFRNRKPPCLCILCHCCLCFYFSCSQLCLLSSYLRKVKRYQYCGSASMGIRSDPWFLSLKFKKFTGPAPRLRMNGCGKEAEPRRPESPWTSSRFVIWSVLFTCSSHTVQCTVVHPT